MTEQRAIGRRTKLTPGLRDEVCVGIRSGCYAKIAAERVGIAESTYYAWKQRGEDDLAEGKTTIHSEFVESIKKAESLIESELIASCLRVARYDEDRPGDFDWKAAMTFMERRWPDRWSRNERREHSGVVGIAPINLASLTDEELDQLDRLTAKAEGLARSDE